MSTFKVGDGVVGQKGFSTVVCVGTHYNNEMICVEYSAKSADLHDGKPNITGFRGKDGCCWWHLRQDLKSAKLSFKGNKQ